MIVLGILNFNWIVVGFSVFILITRYILQLFTINKSAKILGERKFYLTIPIFDIFLPLFNLFILIFGRKNRNIKWK